MYVWDNMPFFKRFDMFYLCLFIRVVSTFQRPMGYICIMILNLYFLLVFKSKTFRQNYPWYTWMNQKALELLFAQFSFFVPIEYRCSEILVKHCLKTLLVLVGVPALVPWCWGLSQPFTKPWSYMDNCSIILTPELNRKHILLLRVHVRAKKVPVFFG